MPPFLSTHKGPTETEYLFVYAPGFAVHDLLCQYSANQGAYRNGASVYIYMHGAMVYDTSENVTPDVTR